MNQNIKEIKDKGNKGHLLAEGVGIASTRTNDASYLEAFHADTNDKDQPIDKEPDYEVKPIQYLNLPAFYSFIVGIVTYVVVLAYTGCCGIGLPKETCFGMQVPQGCRRRSIVCPPCGKLVFYGLIAAMIIPFAKLLANPSADLLANKGTMIALPAVSMILMAFLVFQNCRKTKWMSNDEKLEKTPENLTDLNTQLENLENRNFNYSRHNPGYSPILREDQSGEKPNFISNPYRDTSQIRYNSDEEESSESSDSEIKKNPELSADKKAIYEEDEAAKQNKKEMNEWKQWNEEVEAAKPKPSRRPAEIPYELSQNDSSKNDSPEEKEEEKQRRERIVTRWEKQSHVTRWEKHRDSLKSILDENHDPHMKPTCENLLLRAVEFLDELPDTMESGFFNAKVLPELDSGLIMKSNKLHLEVLSFLKAENDLNVDLNEEKEEEKQRRERIEKELQEHVTRWEKHRDSLQSILDENDDFYMKPRCENLLLRAVEFLDEELPNTMEPAWWYAKVLPELDSGLIMKSNELHLEVLSFLKSESSCFLALNDRDLNEEEKKQRPDRKTFGSNQRPDRILQFEKPNSRNRIENELQEQSEKHRDDLKSFLDENNDLHMMKPECANLYSEAVELLNKNLSKNIMDITGDDFLLTMKEFFSENKIEEKQFEEKQNDEWTWYQMDRAKQLKTPFMYQFFDIDENEQKWLSIINNIYNSDGIIKNKDFNEIGKSIRSPLMIHLDFTFNDTFDEQRMELLTSNEHMPENYCWLDLVNWQRKSAYFENYAKNNPDLKMKIDFTEERVTLFNRMMRLAKKEDLASKVKKICDFYSEPRFMNMLHDKLGVLVNPNFNPENPKVFHLMDNPKGLTDYYAQLLPLIHDKRLEKSLPRWILHQAAIVNPDKSINIVNDIDLMYIAIQQMPVFTYEKRLERINVEKNFKKEPTSFLSTARSQIDNFKKELTSAQVDNYSVDNWDLYDDDWRRDDGYKEEIIWFNAFKKKVTFDAEMDKKVTFRFGDINEGWKWIVFWLRKLAYFEHLAKEYATSGLLYDTSYIYAHYSMTEILTKIDDKRDYLLLHVDELCRRELLKNKVETILNRKNHRHIFIGYNYIQNNWRESCDNLEDPLLKINSMNNRDAIETLIEEKISLYQLYKLVYDQRLEELLPEWVKSEWVSNKLDRMYVAIKLAEAAIYEKHLERSDYDGKNYKYPSYKTYYDKYIK